VVSVFSYAKASSAFAPAVFVVAVVSLSAAHAEDTIGVGGCVGAPGSFNCVVRVGPAGDPYVRTVPQPLTDEDKARTEARDHKWIDRCHPTIAQDRYGVPRYHYAAWGCEFGVIE
jgi:hypothetical protein